MTTLDGVYNKAIFSLILFPFIVFLFSHPTSKTPAGGPIDRSLFAPSTFRCTYTLISNVCVRILYFIEWNLNTYTRRFILFCEPAVYMAHAKYNRKKDVFNWHFWIFFTNVTASWKEILYLKKCSKNRCSVLLIFLKINSEDLDCFQCEYVHLKISSRNRFRRDLLIFHGD